MTTMEAHSRDMAYRCLGDIIQTATELQLFFKDIDTELGYKTLKDLKEELHREYLEYDRHWSACSRQRHSKLSF